MKTLAWLGLVVAAAAWFTAAVALVERPADARPTMTKEALGALLFADPSLSEPAGQACATCHDATRAFADPRGTATSEGAVRGRFGARNAPSIVYASFTPPLSAGGDDGYSGGLFWDGRAKSLEEQAKGPLLNPLEMNNADAAMILRKLKASPNAANFVSVYGPFADADKALGHLVDALAAYEAVIPKRFTSKYDAYLAGNAELTAAEARGLRLFESKKTGPCTQCHLDRPADDGSPPLFTDFGYDNIGIPHDIAKPYYEVDRGRHGQFKAPTLRNVAATGPYGHNGYFKTLKEVVDFYNTRDAAGAWLLPEEPRGMNRKEMGNLHLTDEDENDLVAFLETLTDGYVP